MPNPTRPPDTVATDALISILVGKRYLHKVTIQTIQTITGCLLLDIAISLLAAIL